MINLEKYYNKRPIHTTYRGWNIRKLEEYKSERSNEVLYTCDVVPGWKMIQSTNIDDIYGWVDQQIKLGLVQKEYA